jgi:hypothetical protein
MIFNKIAQVPDEFCEGCKQKWHNNCAAFMAAHSDEEYAQRITGDPLCMSAKATGKYDNILLSLNGRISGHLRSHVAYLVEFSKPVYLRCFKGPAIARDKAKLAFFQDAFAFTYYKTPNRSHGYNFDGLWNLVQKITDPEGVVIFDKKEWIKK